MNFRIVIVSVLVALGVTGCGVPNPRSIGVIGDVGIGIGASPAPDLGVIVDEELRVVEIYPESAAEKAGVKLGDVLVDVTWIPSDAPAYAPPSDVVSVTEVNGVYFVSPIVIPGAVTPIPSPVASYIEKETLPFTESGRVHELIRIGVPLRLTIIRDGEELELTVTPTPPRGRPEFATATPTAVPPSYQLF